MLLGVISGILSFSLFVMGHILVSQLNSIHRAKNIILLVKLSVICLTGFILVIYYVNLIELTPSAFKGSVLLALLWGYLIFFGFLVLYMPFYYTIATSLSVQSLILLHGCTTLKLENLQETFASRQIVLKRLQLMVDNHYLAIQKGEYILTNKGKFLAKIFRYIKLLWRLGPGG